MRTSWIAALALAVGIAASWAPAPGLDARQTGIKRAGTRYWVARERLAGTREVDPTVGPRSAGRLGGRLS